VSATGSALDNPRLLSPDGRNIVTPQRKRPRHCDEIHLSKRLEICGVWWEMGEKVIFWHDVWLRDCPLKIKFTSLFCIWKQQNWEVTRVLYVFVFVCVWWGRGGGGGFKEKSLSPSRYPLSILPS
jgi:hypothetical protein